MHSFNNFNPSKHLSIYSFLLSDELNINVQKNYIKNNKNIQNI